MECNRGEALRAKEIAERKFLAKDMKGAKKFAIKAQKIYPELEGISQMLMTLEVYISAEADRIQGESNWYGVLGVTPLADDETIRKQYRKLALVLHPDKNRSIGAEGAFQFVSQAWSLLSDKSKRTAYDKSYRTGFQQRNQTTRGVPPAPSQNGFHNFANTTASQTRAPKNGNTDNITSKKNDNPTPGPNPARKKEHHTFWTVCHRCKMQYEYLRMYLNHNLLCPNCHEAYFAVEIEPPSTNISKTSSSSRNNMGAHQGSSKSNHNNFQWVPFSESTGAPSVGQAANMVQQAYEKVKQERQKTQAATRKEEALRRRKLSSKRFTQSSGHTEFAKRRKGVENFGTSKDKMKQVNCESGILSSSSCLKRDSFCKCRRKHDGVCHADIKCLLMGKACEDIHKKLNDGTPAATIVTDVLESIKENETAGVKDASLTHGSLCNQNKLCESEEKESPLLLNKLNSDSLGAYPDIKLVERMSIDVPSPDFHDFAKGRTEECFCENQVWAVYDDRDGMPRHYAMIQNVISINPFKVKMSWLSPVAHVICFSSGFSKTCGEFRIGKGKICDSIEWFSHIVRWMKQSSKTIQIYPRKRDVWALYRNWSPEWNELTGDKAIRKYDMIQVIDYDEELGVIVIPLVKVAGFKTVFHQNLSSREIRRIPKEEMSRFSHQVPCHLLTLEEGSKALKGCHELDPAAIPLHFLEVMSNIEEIEFMESDEDIEFVKAVDCYGNTITNIEEGIS